MPQIAVIGSGITGTTTAYALSQLGFEVSIFDRHRYPAMETSFANGGQLSASNAEVWNHWSTIIKGLAWMLRKDAPLLMNPAISWHKYAWMMDFIASIRNYELNTIETTRLAIAARRHMFDIAEREGIDFDHVKRGILHVYWDKKGFDAAARVNDLLTKGGLARHAVTVDEINTIEPTLHGSLYGGFFTPSDSTGDIHKFTNGLAQACTRHGVRFHLDCDVKAIHTGDRVRLTFTEGQDNTAREVSAEFDGVVICAGVQSRKFAGMVGDRVNVYPVKGYSITAHLDDEESQHAAPWVSLLDDRAKIVTSRLGVDRFRVAGTAEFNGFNYDIRSDRTRPLVDWTRSLFPSVSTKRVVPWAGLRPMMPNMMPKVAKGRRVGIFYNTGHGHLGWTLSAATADIVANLVADTYGRPYMPQTARVRSGSRF